MISNSVAAILNKPFMNKQDACSTKIKFIVEQASCLLLILVQHLSFKTVKIRSPKPTKPTKLYQINQGR